VEPGPAPRDPGDAGPSSARQPTATSAQPRTVHAAASAGAAMPDSETRGHDLQRLSDTASHLGLAAARYGDRETARDAWQLSRRVAEQDLNHDVSRIARADTNLAGLTAETGHGPDAASVISGVFATRLVLAERQPENAAADRDGPYPGRHRANRRPGRRRRAAGGRPAGGPADPGGRPGTRRHRRGPAGIRSGPAGSRPSGRRAPSPGGGRRHAARPVPGRLLPSPGRSPLAGQDSAGARAAPPRSARTASTPATR
jgi:hypothetical protein